MNESENISRERYSPKTIQKYKANKPKNEWNEWNSFLVHI